MGGDHGPRTTLPAAIAALDKFPSLSLQLFGKCAEIEPHLDGLIRIDAIEVVDCAQIIDCSQRPATALRNGQDSSMYRAVQAVAEGRADACLSAGNTGALMAISRYLLRMVYGIDRPAICSAVPNRTGKSYFLDLGANVDSSAAQLLQFAVMGSVLCSILEGIASPRIALLNIGTEAIKGNEQVKLASKLFEEHPALNFVGYVEGDKLLNGEADVVVGDGFACNIALKSIEGSALYIYDKLTEIFSRGFMAGMLGKMMQPILGEVRAAIDPRQFNGAVFAGLRGVVVKSHGSADQNAFEYAIQQTVAAVEQDLGGKIEASLETLLQE